MAGRAHVENGEISPVLIYMEAASIQINPMGTLNGAWLPMFRPTTNPASAPTRGAIATESCRLHRIALARRSGKIAGIAGMQWVGWDGHSALASNSINGASAQQAIRCLGRGRRRCLRNPASLLT